MLGRSVLSINHERVRHLVAVECLLTPAHDPRPSLPPTGRPRTECPGVLWYHSYVVMTELGPCPRTANFDTTQALVKVLDVPVVDPPGPAVFSRSARPVLEGGCRGPGWTKRSSPVRPQSLGGADHVSIGAGVDGRANLGRGFEPHL